MTYVMFKKMKSIEVILAEMTDWCIFRSCARKGLAKEGWCFVEIFGKDGLYLNVDISFAVIIWPVFNIDFVVVNQNAKNVFCFNWGKARRVMKTFLTKTEYKMTRPSEQICKNTLEHLLSK